MNDANDIAFDALAAAATELNRQQQKEIRYYRRWAWLWFLLWCFELLHDRVRAWLLT